MSRIGTSEMGFLQVVQHSNTGRPILAGGQRATSPPTILVQFKAAPPSTSMTG